MKEVNAYEAPEVIEVGAAQTIILGVKDDPLNADGCVGCEPNFRSTTMATEDEWADNKARGHSVPELPSFVRDY